MRQVIFLYFIFITLLYGCDNEGIDKTRIIGAERLNSPDGKFSLYRYEIENDMSFGASGMTVLSITESNKTYDYTKSNYFRIDDPTPFYIRWKGQDTILLKCITAEHDSLGQKLPTRTEIKRWKDWTFEVDYYSMLSASSENQYFFDTYSIDSNSITFQSRDDTLVFRTEEVQIALDTNHIYIKNFTSHTFDNNSGLMFSHYDIILKKGYNPTDFTKQQAFSKTRP